MNNVVKRWLPDVLAVVVFAVLAFAYFYPADTEGRILYQHDTSSGVGAGQETGEYRQRTGEISRWTNALFSGMPTYQLSPAYSSTQMLGQVEQAYHLWLPDNVWYLFAYLLGFYILLRAFDFKSYLAALGSLFWAFSTYFLIIIAAGHLWKVMALAYLPPLIAGIVLTYRGKLVSGLAVTAIFSALEVHANHFQMTYYYLFIMLFMAAAFLVDALRKKQLAQWLKATGLCIAGGLLGTLVNLSNIYHTWEYQQHTMRGGTELKTDGEQASTIGGLNREYITQWSYGIGETWTLLVPNANGGSHGEQLSDYPSALEKADPQVRDICAQWYPYFGDQPFTAGPVYVGAFVFTLFILSLYVLRGPLKWALIGVTVLSILLSWGHNFMGMTDFFIDHIPMYSKFRTVSSILVIAEFTIPLLAMLGLKRVIDEPAVLTRRINLATLLCTIGTVLTVWAISAESMGLGVLGALLAVAGMVLLTINYCSKNATGFAQKTVPLSPLALTLLFTAGTLLLFALMPTTFFSSFSSQGDVMRLSRYFGQQELAIVIANLEKVRQAVFTADCWRSLAIVAIGTVLLVLFAKKKLKALPTVLLMAVLCLVDLWLINKRYLNDDMFQNPQVKQTAHAIKPVNQFILQDKDPDYRVLNFASDTFNENETSYYHKSVGGYHAAKLGRYNELISAYIAPEMSKAAEAMNASAMQLDSVDGGKLFPVINMLNTRYFIINDNAALRNPYAQGNAWFADRLMVAADATEELGALATIDLRHEAVADKQFEQLLGQPQPLDSTATVRIDSYEPNELHYTVNSTNGGLLVFSEIYYPGWKCVVDGNKEVELGRVNYVLRAMHIDGGQHSVVLTFRPQTVKRTETIAYVSFGIMVLLVVAAIVITLKKRKKTE